MSSVVEREIAEQADAIERQLRLGRDATERVAGKIRARTPSSVVIAARGSSDNAGRYAQYLLGVHNRLVVTLATPSVFTLYDAPPLLSDALVIGVSQSGRSPDIVAVLEEGRRQGAQVVAVTSDTESPLAKAADMCLALHAGEELAVAATKTYTTELCALAMLSAAMDASADRWEELGRLPTLVRRAHENTRSLGDGAKRFAESGRFVVLGRGFNYATAFEISLKLKETSYVVAESYSSADFRHGPSAMLEKGFPVVLIAPSGKTHADSVELLALCEQRGAEVVAISDDEAVLSRAALSLAIPPGVPEWLSPFTAIVPGQVFAVSLARARGLDPDKPRGLSKITETR